MINASIDNRYAKRVASLNLPDRLLADTDAGCLVTSYAWEIIAVNSSYCLFHNLFSSSFIKEGEILQKGFFASYPDSFETKLRGFIKDSADGTNLKFEFFKNINNKAFSFAITVSRLHDKQNRFYGVSVMVKKSEILTSTESVKEDDLYKFLIKTSASVYQLANAALIYTYTSDALESITGFTPAEMLGRSVFELVHPDDKEAVRGWLINVRRQPEKQISHEYRVKTTKGDYVWIENNATNMLNDGNINSVVMNFRNIQAKKVADHALVHAEQRLSLLLNNTEESFIILNSRLRIITYNKAAQEKSPFFYIGELQSGLSVLDLVQKDEIPTYISLFEEVFAGKEIFKETKYADVEGVEHIYGHTFRPLFDAQNDIFGVFITSTDITERRRLTEEVALNSERLKTAQEIAKLGYLEYDLSSKTVFCSDQFFEILEIEKNIIHWTDFFLVETMVHEDDREILKNKIKRSVSEKTKFTQEFRYLTQSKQQKVLLAIGGVELNESGKSTKLRITLQDITENKHALLAIQTLESKFKSLFDNSIDGVVLSKDNGRIISANPSVCKMLGYTLNEITNLTSCDLIDVKSASASEILEIQKAYGAFVGELYLKHKSGHFVPVEVTSISMKDGSDESYLSTIIRDITEKKKSEHEQNALTEELVKNNQDLQQFSFITSHNLRAPVANLLSLLSLYDKQNPADEFNQLLLEKFEEATNQLNQTLNDLVNVLVIKSNNNIERESITFKEIFLAVKKNIDGLLSEKKGTIQADFSYADTVMYNRIHLESIFLNMVSNAIRYSSPDRKPEIKLKSYKQNEWIILEFADNGLGIDLDRHGERLFGLYQRFHSNSKEGKGLGLYMTRTQVMAMGGKIEVESTVDQGTTFRIFFKS